MPLRREETKSPKALFFQDFRAFLNKKRSRRLFPTLRDLVATLAVIDTSTRESEMPILCVYLNQYAQGILEFLKLIE